MRRSASRAPPDRRCRAASRSARRSARRRAHPRLGLRRRLTELDVPRNESAMAFLPRHVDEPDLRQQLAHRRPRRLIVEEVVALGDDKPRLRRHRKAARDRLFDIPVERGGVDDVRGTRADAFEQRAIAVGVEGVDRALAVQPSESGAVRRPRGESRPWANRRRQRMLTRSVRHTSSYPRPVAP